MLLADVTEIEDLSSYSGTEGKMLLGRGRRRRDDDDPDAGLRAGYVSNSPAAPEVGEKQTAQKGSFLLWSNLHAKKDHHPFFFFFFRLLR